MSRHTKREGKKEWKKVTMLNHIIAKEGNYMWATLVVLMPIYLIYLIFAVNIPGDYFYGVTSGVMLFFGYLRYCAMTEIWSRTEKCRNFSKRLMPFPINRKILVLSHAKAVFLVQFLLGILAVGAGMISRMSWQLQWRDAIWLVSAGVNTLLIVGHRMISIIYAYSNYR